MGWQSRANADRPPQPKKVREPVPPLDLWSLVAMTLMSDRMKRVLRARAERKEAPDA